MSKREDNITQICRLCKEEKPLECFAKSKSMKLGVLTKCKICDARRRRIEARGTDVYVKRAMKSDGVHKQCPKCWEIKTVDNFYNHKSLSDRKNSWCKECKRTSWRRRWENNKEVNKEKSRAERIYRKYKISVAKYDEILSKQGGRCAICGNGKGNAKGYRLMIDHSHETGVVRGLLCWNCNAGIGYFKDNPSYLYLAAQYLGGTFNV